MLKIGTMTFFGEIVGITNKVGERYYFIINSAQVTSLIPASTIEEMEQETE